MKGTLKTLQSGNLSYEIVNGGALFMASVAAMMRDDFGFTLKPDEEDHWVDCYKDNVRLTVAWSIREDFFLMAWSAEGNPWVERLMPHVDRLLGE